MTISRSKDDTEKAPDADSSGFTLTPDSPSTPDGYDPEHPELTYAPGTPDAKGDILCIVLDGRCYEVQNYGRKGGREILKWLNEHRLSVVHGRQASDVFAMATPKHSRLRKKGPDEKNEQESLNRAYVDRDAIQDRSKRTTPEGVTAPEVQAPPAHLGGKGAS